MSYEANFKNLRVALVHDWLTGMRGGEKCLEVLCELFPQADIFTLMHKKGSTSELIENKKITTFFLQKIPNIFETYRNFLPLFPIAIESFDLSKYNLIISTSHCAAKGVKKSKKTYHICYCFTPMRYAWVSFNDYFGTKNLISKLIIKAILTDLKRWDLNTNKRVNDFIAISETVRGRIKEFYKRDSQVIYPPVDTEFYFLDNNIKRQDFYLIVSALVPYKRIDLAIRVFNKLNKKLLIVGSCPIENNLRKIANLKYIEFLGWQSNETIRTLYQTAKALIFPGIEDFGIVPVEAQACGCPVIAYKKGGALETVIPDVTGVFFERQTTDSLDDAINYFESIKNKFNIQIIRNNALRFNKEIFSEKIKKIILENYERFNLCNRF